MAKRTKRGLTLAEIILAVLIASIGVIGVAMMMATMWRAAADGKFQAAASNIGRMSIERMRGDANYLNQIYSATSPTVSATNLTVDGTNTTQFTSMIYAATVGAPAANFLNVQVNVSWQQDHGSRQIELETYLPKP